jgi:upstream activation factor subunit UAF30
MPTKTKTKSSAAKTASRTKSKKSKTTKTKAVKTSKKAAVAAVAEVVEEVAEAAPEKVIKKRRVVSRESVFADFDSLQQNVEAEIEKTRANADKGGKVLGVRYLRSLNKAIKQLKKDTIRAMKQKKKNPNRAKNTSSGFMKPVKISNEMSSFTGWEKDELKSRVDVTKYICGYIRDNDLQNPADRRQIVPDKKLTNLLKLDKKGLAEEPLTYYSLQKKIQPHFIKEVKK